MAVKKANTTESEMSIHIKIDSPNLIRKEVLSLTIDTIELLKKLRAFRDAKAKKINLIKDLRKEVGDIRNLTKDLVGQNLRMYMEAVDNLPTFRRQREALEEIEKMRNMSEQRWASFESHLASDISKEPKAPPRELPAQRIRETPKDKPKPRDKLEADLEALREKMAQL